MERFLKKRKPQGKFNLPQSGKLPHNGIDTVCRIVKVKLERVQSVVQIRSE